MSRRRACAIALLAAAALRPAAARAQSPQEPTFRFGRIDIGVQGVDLDQDSSAFREYREMPKGFVVPYLRVEGRGRVPYHLRVQNGGRDDGRYFLTFEPGSFTIATSYLRIPHRFTNDALSILIPDASGLQAPPGVQARNQAALERQFAQNRNGIDATLLSSLANASLPGGQLLDVKLLRERGRLDVSLARSRDFDARVSYAFDKRDGTRVAGASFGYQNVVEIAEPIHYRTDDVTASAEWKVKFGLVRGSLAYSRFANDLQSVTFQNPFRATDSAELNAMFGPSPFGVDGSREGRIALPPDNEAMRGSLGFLAKLPGRSRFNADFSLGQWKQNEPFIPFSSNSAITSPVRAADTAALPARSLNGEMQTFTQSYTFSSRPLDGLVFTARYRYYKLSNDTPRLTVPGEAYFDGLWNFNSRISVPYAYTKDRLFAAAAYEWGRATFEAGFSYEGWDRAFRETRRTTEGLFHVKADVRPRDSVLARALVQWGARDYDLYLPRAGESSSYPNGKPPTLLSELRRPDQSKRDSARYGGELLLTPGNASLMFSYLKGTLDYYATSYGEQKAGSEVLSAEADYTPLERLNLFAYASRENLTSLVHGAQRGATGAPNPATEWRSDVRDRATSFGLGGSVAVVKDKADLRIQAGFQKVDGNNDLFATAGALDIAAFDDTRIRSLSAEFGYKPRPHWTVALGGFVEDFELADSTRSGLPTYVPGGFFLVGTFGDYNAKVFYLKLSYNW
jgi:MtrB/PioB family decaheme-associated outer membrane protein